MHVQEQQCYNFRFLSVCWSYLRKCVVIKAFVSGVVKQIPTAFLWGTQSCLQHSQCVCMLSIPGCVTPCPPMTPGSDYARNLVRCHQRNPQDATWEKGTLWWVSCNSGLFVQHPWGKEQTPFPVIRGTPKQWEATFEHWEWICSDVPEFISVTETTYLV